MGLGRTCSRLVPPQGAQLDDAGAGHDVWLGQLARLGPADTVGERLSRMLDVGIDRLGGAPSVAPFLSIAVDDDGVVVRARRAGLVAHVVLSMGVTPLARSIGARLASRPAVMRARASTSVPWFKVMLANDTVYRPQDSAAAGSSLGSMSSWVYTALSKRCARGSEAVAFLSAVTHRARRPSASSGLFTSVPTISIEHERNRRMQARDGRRSASMSLSDKSIRPFGGSTGTARSGSTMRHGSFTS